MLLALRRRSSSSSSTFNLRKTCAFTRCAQNVTGCQNFRMTVLQCSFGKISSMSSRTATHHLIKSSPRAQISNYHRMRVTKEATTKPNILFSSPNVRRTGCTARTPRRCSSTTANNSTNLIPDSATGTTHSHVVRQKFLSYFQNLGHAVRPSASLIPHGDSSLLFTSAGMVPFKDYFLHPDQAPEPQRFCSVQKCLRTNDLELVGKTARHHSFFEMLGFFSFGSSTKEDAISASWLFLLNELQLPKEKLHVTIHETDNESHHIWQNVIGLTPDRIMRRNEDNFWSMGPTGPCGPSTEIYFDQGIPDYDGESHLEIWNIVFTSFNRLESGTLEPLPKLCIDTGMGLERLVSVLQGKTNNFDTDIFVPIIAAAKKLFPLPPTPDVAALRTIADHLRAIVFLISDGVMPSNDGRGYVVRRMVRRMINCGKKLGFPDEPWISRLFNVLISTIPAYGPLLQEQSEMITKIIQSEEIMFFRTLNNGLAVLNDEILRAKQHRKENILADDVVFCLYDTYGFPIDISEAIAQEHGLKVNVQNVNKLLDKQRDLARKGAFIGTQTKAFEQTKAWQFQNIFPRFSGYDGLIEKNAKIEAVAQEDGEYWICINPCPFYPEGGGQVGDRGFIQLQDNTIVNVIDTQRPYTNGIALKLEPSEATKKLVEDHILCIGAHVKSAVLENERQATAKNHTATHMLQAALKQVLGASVYQAGSEVSPEGLRFDFMFPRALTSSEIEQVEKIVNGQIHEGKAIEEQRLEIKEAKKLPNVVFLFDEKYPDDEVRVISIPGVSTEFCGGTHVHNISEIGAFKVTSEKSSAAGKRRIEATTGAKALAWYEEQWGLLRRLAKVLDVTPPQLEKRVTKLVTQQKSTEKDLADYVLSTMLLDAVTVSGSWHGYPLSVLVLNPHRSLPAIVVDCLRKHASQVQQQNEAQNQTQQAMPKNKTQKDLHNTKTVHIYVAPSLQTAFCTTSSSFERSAADVLKALFSEIGFSVQCGGKGPFAQGRVTGLTPEMCPSFLEALSSKVSGK